MKRTSLFFVLVFLLMRFTASAQSYCDTVFHIVPGSAVFSASNFSVGDSMLEVLITNISAAQSMAYPTAGLVLHDTLPAGMQLASVSVGYNTVFASSFVPGDTQTIRFYFDVSQPIPYNYSVGFTVWADADNSNGPIDSCAVRDSFEVNLNPLFMTRADLLSQNQTFSVHADAGSLHIWGDPGIYRLYSIQGRALSQLLIKPGETELHMAMDIYPGIYLLRNEAGQSHRFIAH